MGDKHFICNGASMSSVQCLREFVTERLTAAAEEILGVFVKTLLEYEEEIERQRRLLDLVWKPEIKLHRIEPAQQHVCNKEEFFTDQHLCNQERKASLDQEDPEPSQIEEEQEELCSSQKGEQRVLKEESDTFMLTPTNEESDDSEPQPNPYHQLLFHSSPGAHNVKNSLLSETHYNTCKDKKSVKCDTCGKSFRYKSKLKVHLRIHTGEKPYVCSACGRAFRHSSVLKLHMRTHTGEKPHSCKICGRPFRHSSVLKLHMRTHTGEKPYVCNTCEKRFNQRQNLQRHMKVHNG